MACSLDKLYDTIPDELSAVRFLQERKILPCEMQCDKGHTMKLNTSKRMRWRCRKIGCEAEKGVRADTWFWHSKLPFCVLLQFIYIWSNDCVSIRLCNEELNMGCNAVVEWSQALREVCLNKMLTSETAIGGPGLYVEIDESVYTRSSNRAGKSLPQQWIFGGVCQQTKECFIIPIPNICAGTLLPLIRERVKPGSIIVSSRWKLYTHVQNQEYDHLMVNYQLNFVDPKTLAENQIGKLWGLVKCGSNRRSASRKYLKFYLAEFMWRQKFAGTDLFEQILKDIAWFCESIR